MMLVLFVVPFVAGCVGGDRDDRTADDGGAVDWTLTCLLSCPSRLSLGVQQEWEPSVAIDPKDPLHVVAAVVEFNKTDHGVAQGWITTYASWDGGRTWTKGTFGDGPPPADDPSAPGWRLIDPRVQFAADGTVLFVALSRSGYGVVAPTPAGFQYVAYDYSIVAAVSVDGGLTSPEVVRIADGVGLETTAGIGPGNIVDFATTDRTPSGILLAVWTNKRVPSDAPDAAPASYQIMLSSSADHGKTWGTSRLVAAGINRAPVLAVIDETTWLIATARCRNEGSECALQGAADIIVYRTSDGGTTWAESLVGRGTDVPPPAISYGGGRVFVTFSSLESDGRRLAQYVSSDDEGAGWSGALSLDPHTDVRPGYFMTPSVAVDDTGTAYIAYYWSDGHDRVEVRAVAIHPDGTVSPPLTLDDDLVGPPAMFGDYMGMDGSATGAFAVWVGGRAEPRVTQGASDLRGGSLVAIGGQPLPLAAEQAGPADAPRARG